MTYTAKYFNLPVNFKIGHIIKHQNLQFEIVDYITPNATLRLLPEDEKVKIDFIFGVVSNITTII